MISIDIALGGGVKNRDGNLVGVESQRFVHQTVQTVLHPFVTCKHLWCHMQRRLLFLYWLVCT